MFDWINSMYSYMTSTDLKNSVLKTIQCQWKLLYNMKFQTVCIVFSNQNNKCIKIVYGYTETKAGSILLGKYVM